MQPGLGVRTGPTKMGSGEWGTLLAAVLAARQRS